MNNRIFYNNEARMMLVNGMEILNKALAVTIGPRGRNVVLANRNKPTQIINDGITIAKEIYVKNSISNMGISLIRQASSKTNEIAGDGTTTSTILAYAIVKEGIRSIESGMNPVIIKQGIEKSSRFLNDQLIECANPLKSLNDIYNIAYISSGSSHELAQLIKEAIKIVGKEGIVNLEEGNSSKDELIVANGFSFDKGFVSSYFLTDQDSNKIIQNNPYILLVNDKIKAGNNDLLNLLSNISKTKRSVILIARDIEPEMVSTLIINNNKNIINVTAVKAPGFGNEIQLLLEDIATLVGANIVGENEGITLKNISISNLGQADKVIVNKNNTVIIKTHQLKSVIERCNNIKKQIKISDSLYEKELLQFRLQRLTGGVATIKVGAVTETEMRDKKLRLEDSINATKAAILEGMVPGGGHTLLYLSNILMQWAIENLIGDEREGAFIFARALKLPAKQIIKNTGSNESLILQKISNMQFGYGFNSASCTFCNIYETGIVDPMKVTRSALQNASSIAKIVLSTECIVAE
uniref:Chaperonin GroEL, chloroplastic n=1 Tax=Porphyridium purpureum TaxID=35688 RepID=W0RZ55_PORPP|nr:60 kDa chaperone protein [Porphyridium purpureum]BAO23732.1 60 kDa chaperone protein [Porphyridium purpureum]